MELFLLFMELKLAPTQELFELFRNYCVWLVIPDPV